MTVRLYDAIKSSYSNKKAKNKILSEGYIKDKKLSSENQKVFIILKKTNCWLMLPKVTI